MNDLSQTIQDVPLAGLVPVVLLIVVGLLMWAAGKRLLKPGFAAAGLLVGGALGWLIGESINIGIPGWVAALILGVVFAAVAALTYRLAVAVALALVLGIASPLAVISINELQGAINIVERDAEQSESDAPLPPDDADNGLPDWLPQPPEQPNGDPQPTDGFEQDASQQRIDEIEQWLSDRVRQQFPGVPLQPGQSPEELAQQFGFNDEMAEHFDQVKDFAGAIIDGIADVWNQTPEGLRPVIIAAAILGALLGLLVGALIPVFSASVVTAFGGSLLWLFGSGIVAERFADGAMLPSTGRAWLVLWIVVSVIGLCIQWMFRPRVADKSER